jgi:hypothetical protein
MNRAKQKCVKAMNKIEEHADDILVVTLAVQAIVGVGLAVFFQDKYIKEKHTRRVDRAREAQCHANATMLYNNTAEDTKTVIGVKNNHYVILEKGIPFEV